MLIQGPVFMDLLQVDRIVACAGSPSRYGFLFSPFTLWNNHVLIDNPSQYQKKSTLWIRPLRGNDIPVIPQTNESIMKSNILGKLSCGCYIYCQKLGPKEIDKKCEINSFGYQCKGDCWRMWQNMCVEYLFSLIWNIWKILRGSRIFRMLPMDAAGWIGWRKSCKQGFFRPH